MAIISGSDLRSYLGLSANEDAARLDLFALGAAAWVVNRTGRTWEQQTLTELYRGSDTVDLVLNHYPVNSITSVTIDGTALDVTNTKIVELTNPQMGILTRTGGDVWPRVAYRSITVVYVGGPDGAPDDLVLGTLELAAWAYQTTGGRVSVSGPEVSATFSALSNGLMGLPLLEAAIRANGDVLGRGK